MKSLKFLITISFFLPLYVFAMPSYPMAFWGNLTVDSRETLSGAIVTVYDASSTELGTITTRESGKYGYDGALTEKLLISEGKGILTFKVKEVGGIEVIGCSPVSYSSFNSGLTVEKNLAFRTFGCDTVPDSNGIATLSTSTDQVVITNGTATTSITVDIGTTNPTIDVSSFISNGTGTLPAISIISVNANNATVAISSSTVVSSASTTWDGIISAPTIATVTLPVESGQTKTSGVVIELGLIDMKLTFSKSVKIVLPGQVGKRAGYTRTGTTFTEITNICVSPTDQVAIDGDLVGLKEECKIDSGSDMIIWTKHFTTFASYSQSATPVVSSSGSGGGGGGNSYIAHPIIIATTTVTTIPLVVATTTLITSIISTQGCSGGNKYNPFTGAICVNNASTQEKVPVITYFKFLKDLRLGMTNNDVKELQKFLIADGFLKSDVTGYFGTMTRTALMKWQGKNKLTAGGTLEKNGRALLNGRGEIAITASSSTPVAIPVVTFIFLKDLKLGARNNDVNELQKILINEGFLNGESTGYFGVMTKASLIKWQAKNNLDTTGYFGSMSRGILNKR